MMEEREFFKRIERFRREYEGVLEEEEIERCVYEALRDHAAYKAYVCASEVLVRKKRKEKPAAQRPQQPAAELPVAAAPSIAPPSEARESGKKRRFSIGRRSEEAKGERAEGKVEEKAAEGGMEPRAGRHISLKELPWQAHAGLASLALSAAHPLLALVSLPVVALLSRRRNTAPFWTDGGAVVWPGVGRFRFYRVERVFKDVGGMGASEFSNYLISTLHEFNGIYYDKGQAWILLEEGADVEAARTVLRRFGVVVEPRPSPPPVQLPRERASRYLPWALLPLLALAAGPAAGAAAVVPALLIAVLTARDLGHRPAPPMRALSSNASYYSVPDNDAVLSVALAAQPLVESALVVWRADPHYAVKLERRGGWAERLAWWTQSQWRLQALEVIQMARQRLFNLHEKGFVVNGLLNGRVATFAAGRPVGS
ncbi:MAG: hypothetical protein RXR06_10775, partial [Thermoproteus sp.]